LIFFLEDGPITLLAPTDDAFSRLGNDTVNKLIQNPTLLGGNLRAFNAHEIPISNSLNILQFISLLDEVLNYSTDDLVTYLFSTIIHVKQLSSVVQRVMNRIVSTFALTNCAIFVPHAKRVFIIFF
jgi:hypothetical protein